MAFRFQKRIKILPGLSINLSKSGISTSVGPRGVKVTIGNGRQRATLGVPGTGISHSTNLMPGKDQSEQGSSAGSSLFFAVLRGFMAGLFSSRNKRRR